MKLKEINIKLYLQEKDFKKLVNVNELMNKYWEENNSIEATLKAIIISDISRSLDERIKLYSEK